MKYQLQNYNHAPVSRRVSGRSYRQRFIRTASTSIAAILLSTISFYSHVALADTTANGEAATVQTTTSQPAGTIVISELQTGGCISSELSASCTEDPKREFIELYNQSDVTVDLKAWTVQYMSASAGTTTVLATLNGTLGSHASLLIAHSSYYSEISNFEFGDGTDSGKLAKSGGHVQINDETGKMQDKVGWGSATSPLTKSATAPGAGFSLRRTYATDANNSPTATLNNTSNNNLDFTVSDAPTPKSEGYTAGLPVIEIPPASPVPIPAPIPDATQPPPTPMPITPATNCKGIIISELVPNPAGSDTGHEYIELHNPTDETVQLDGCSLQTSATSKVFNFAVTSLQPGEYKAFPDSETTITLPNSAGGTTWLLSAADELDMVIYPANMPDDTAWALVDGMWRQTYALTPSTANAWIALEPCPSGQERNPETNRCVTIDLAGNDEAASDATNGLTACKAGQERNPETNRCRTVDSNADQLAACKAGQVRNSETNRCAATNAVSSATVVACKAGQERNPETNRCRAIAAAAAAKACPAGQERNPETGRCKKSATATASTTKVEDVTSASSANYTRWLLPAVAIVGALAYAVYEWRLEISQKLRALLHKNNRQTAIS